VVVSGEVLADEGEPLCGVQTHLRFLSVARVLRAIARNIQLRASARKC
jgi:hypothetical protein